jgi:hypothetical protein
MYLDYFHIQLVFELVMDQWKMKYINIIIIIHNSRGSSNIDLTITNNHLITAVNEWEISAEDSCSDHSFLKHKIGIDNSTNNVHNYQGIRYIIKEDKYHEFDRISLRNVKNF